VQAEKRRFDAVIAQKRQSEKIRDSLVAEITVIRGIDADRYIWPHVLDQITKALPPYTWLNRDRGGRGRQCRPGHTGCSAGRRGSADSTGRPQVRVWITGSTVDIQAFTTFLRQLAASPWLTDVTPATTSTIIEPTARSPRSTWRCASGWRTRCTSAPSPDPVGEVAPWPCCRRTGRAR